MHIEHENWFWSPQRFHNKTQPQTRGCFEGYKETFVEHSKKPKLQKEIFFLSWQNSEEWRKLDFYQNYVGKMFFFKTVTLSMLSSFIVEALGRPERTFLFSVPLVTNPFPILFTAERNVFIFFLFQNLKISLVSHIFLSFSCNFIF